MISLKSVFLVLRQTHYSEHDLRTKQREQKLGTQCALPEQRQQGRVRVHARVQQEAQRVLLRHRLLHLCPAVWVRHSVGIRNCRVRLHSL